MRNYISGEKPFTHDLSHVMGVSASAKALLRLSQNTKIYESEE